MTAFREPKLKERSPIGDLRRFFWVMEPVRGEIYGCSFTISHKEEVEGGLAVMETKKQWAYDKMLSQVGRPECVIPEGSEFSVFPKLGTQQFDGLRFFQQNLTIRGDGSQLTPADITNFMIRSYQQTGSPDFCPCQPTRESRWLRLKRSVGTWSRNAFSGVRSALRTLGTRLTGKR